MSDRDKLGELAKLVSKLQFSVEGKDTRLMAETENEIHTLARHLPENYRIHRIIETAGKSAEHGSRLAQLYLERCYKLADEDYMGLQQVEGDIQELQDAAG